MKLSWLIGDDGTPWYEFWKLRSGAIGGFIMAAAIFDIVAVVKWLLKGVLS